MFILYLKSLILLDWWKEASIIMDELGKYYHDLDIVEAIIWCMHALILSQAEELTWELICDAIKDYLKAQILFKSSSSNQGEALCCLAIA